VDVVERRIIEETIATTYDRFAVSGQEPSPLGRVSKAQAGTKAVLGSRNLGKRTNGKRQRGIPEPARTGFPWRSNRVEKVGGLPVIRPGEAEIQGEALPYFPVVSSVQEGIMLAEVEGRRPLGDIDAPGGIRYESTPALE